MYILSIDTSTALASVALATEEKVLAESLLPAERCLSARLVPEIERLLAMAGVTIGQIDLFASAIGPGSFTGVRAGVATVQGLALSTGKPCAGFSTLAALAMNLSLVSRPVCALLDARKQEVYGGLYDCSLPLPTALIEDCVMPPATLAEMICAHTAEPVIFLGEGALRYRDLIASRMGAQAIFAPSSHHAGRAANGILLALATYHAGRTVPPDRLLPVYIRPSEAELARQKKQ
ncbi:tRNA (adenosine(37)-N6)-threonylcarbamoyltransferase complex dimerization subunit type 1 TsaB [Geobacter sp. SVR]|uniref:tRNA (adenosine(37)-N6)-threonylcarbamoyltransferase complex dimerization subunit type 1 TsaB n=1 Tax=Geobacter sp. SVR TaxID=2495594 RepID=UPI00143EFCB9|nr:tRNA (adenosine(37)-N6)-threonylcarbamoyltransferase complex dimerization subunit type 1 TsaB [Geobacter sp. SVR]BCS54697.1 tRNA (adenosine(37)-N6)-threonylcarbamoyltransferase complex dimerization subunit type 1 TsaB [Geobacter sp. SVR]GCF87637.1 tRNA (adenosine(37)-N6)-threonylcarbamoyltransferase complex dimerization subunit type 1 TsaB [Geobacter sp. SVR]